MDKGALSRATDGTSAPTPGYLYNDIGKSLTSPQTCVETLNYLSSRLQKKNPHIKKKCLKVLSKISIHATNRGMMKRCIVQNPTAIGLIKDCIAYKGTIDAVTGDQYNIEVRNAAKECLEVVYSDSGDTAQMQSSGGGYGGQLQGGGMAGLGSNSSPTNRGQSGYGSTGQGYGSNSSSGGGYGAPMGGQSGSGHSAGVATAVPGGRTSSMQGIGNPMFSDPRLSQGNNGDTTTLGTLKNVGGAMLDMIKDPLAKNVPGTGLPPGSIGGGGYNPNARPDPYAQPPPGRNNMMAQTGGQWTMASNRGPNAVGNASNSVPEPPSNHQNSEYYKARNAQGGQAFSWAANPSPAPAPSAAPPAVPTGVGGTWASAPPQQQQYSQSVAAQSRQPPASAVAITGTTPSSSNGFNNGGAVHRGVAVGGGDYEKNLILELCPPGGMKAEPPQDKLEEFANAIPSLNPDLVCPALLDALEEGNPWIMRAKALCVIETVLKVEASRGGGEEGGVQAYTDFFYECSGEISPLANHARASVKGPAKRVLTILGVDGSSMMNGATTHGDVAAAAPPPTNLLDFSEEPAPVVQTTIDNSSVAAVPSVGGDSLFSGLNTKAAATTQQQQPATEVPAPPIPVAQPQQQDDLLGGLGTEMNVAPAATNSVPVVSGSGSGDLFGNMNIKSVEAKVETVDSSTAAAVAAGIPSPPSAPASSFGFMNGNNTTTPSSPVPPPKAQVSPASPSSKAFDPLLNMGNTATNTNNNMTNSPNPNNMAQMQHMQMAYQQNMMMMQQQMQQMQMAQQGNFQRQGSGGYVPGMPPQMMPPSPTKQQVMGGNYMRQVPTVGDNSGFSFLGSDPRKEKNKSFDFVKETMKKG